MTKNLLLLVLMLAVGAFGVVGCTSEKPDHDHDHDAGESHDDGDDHDHDHDGDVHSGMEHVLGNVTANGVEVRVHQLGSMTAGAEAALEIEVLKGDPPAAIRLWVGNEKGVGAIKGLAEKEESGAFHAHIGVMSVLTADAKVWIEIENAAGERAAGSVAYFKE